MGRARRAATALPVPSAQRLIGDLLNATDPDVTELLGNRPVVLPGFLILWLPPDVQALGSLGSLA